MRRIIVTISICVSLMTGCATTSTPQFKAIDCPMPSKQSAEYLVGVGDLLNIVVWENAGLSVVVPVRPDGKISTPLVDDMQASGKTPSQLSEDMENVLGEFLRTPEVSVIVTGQGAANQIQLVGEVVSPQSLSYRADLKLLDVLVAVGGMTEFAAGNRANLVRPTQVGQVECRVRLKDLMAGDMTQNIDIYPGDVIVVPKTRF